PTRISRLPQRGVHCPRHRCRGGRLPGARGVGSSCASWLGKVSRTPPTRTAYKSLGYRLPATEGFFVPRRLRVAKAPTPLSNEWVAPGAAAWLGQVVRTRPIARDHLRASDMSGWGCCLCLCHGERRRLRCVAALRRTACSGETGSAPGLLSRPALPRVR